jgi:hypothetical protein
LDRRPESPEATRRMARWLSAACCLCGGVEPFPKAGSRFRAGHGFNRPRRDSCRGYNTECGRSSCR